MQEALREIAGESGIEEQIRTIRKLIAEKQERKAIAMLTSEVKALTDQLDVRQSKKTRKLEEKTDKKWARRERGGDRWRRHIPRRGARSTRRSTDCAKAWHWTSQSTTTTDYHGI